MAAKVIGQGRRVAVALSRFDSKTFLQNFGQTSTHFGVALAPCFTSCSIYGCSGTAKGLAEQESQGVNIGAGVYWSGDRLSKSHGFESCRLLGCHPAWRSPEPVGYSLTDLDRLSSQMKVEEHRHSIARNQNIRRLHVHVHETMNMRS